MELPLAACSSWSAVTLRPHSSCRGAICGLSFLELAGPSSVLSHQFTRLKINTQLRAGCAQSQLIFIDPAGCWDGKRAGLELLSFHSQPALPQEDLGSRKFELEPL